MSHHPQRKEKDCLNCGITVVGKFCYNCGQENIEPKESVWQLILHFFNDITHFDGKFFSSLRYLLFKPGFLPKEYMNGRRARYLNPVRMYIFTSFIFFLIFFSFFQITDKEFEAPILINGKNIDQINKMDMAEFNKFTKTLNKGKPMSRESFSHYLDSTRRENIISLTGNNYKTKLAYDSALASGIKKHNWFERQLIYKKIEISNKYQDHQGKLLGAIAGSLMHHFPQMLFISLPFAALILKLLYVRQKKFYYVSHAIFTIHFYIFVFIAMMLTMGVSKLVKNMQWKWMNNINFLISLIIFFYLYKAMRNFYKQGRGKTIFKYFILLFSFLFLTIFLFFAFMLVSYFQI